MLNPTVPSEFKFTRGWRCIQYEKKSGNEKVEHNNTVLAYFLLSCGFFIVLIEQCPIHCGFFILNLVGVGLQIINGKSSDVSIWLMCVISSSLLNVVSLDSVGVTGLTDSLQPFISSSLEKVSTVRDASREQWCHDISICLLNSLLWKLSPCPGAQTDYLSLEDQWGDSCKPSPEEKDENIHPGWKKTDTNLCVLFCMLTQQPSFLRTQAFNALIPEHDDSVIFM